MDRQFERVQKIRYFGTLMNSKNLISDEIKSGIAAGNRCFYSLRQIFKSEAMTKSVFVAYGSETLAMTEMDMKRMSTWERKILRKIHVPVIEQRM